MAVVIVLLALALLAVVIAVIGAPLRASAARAPLDAAADAARADRAELESAREAKYHEIRDAELDFRTGKLSSEDYAATEADLRAEALTILNRLDALDDAALLPTGAVGGADPPASPKIPAEDQRPGRSSP